MKLQTVIHNHMPGFSVRRRQCIVTLTQDEFDREILERAAGGFGWDVIPARSLSDMLAIDAERIAALVFDRETAGAPAWPDAGAMLRRLRPGVRLVACLRFSEVVHWAALRDSGVFHAVQAPLKDNEVLQSLGFVWNAVKQAENPGQLMPPAAAAVRRLRSIRAVA
ncbi:MAG TPA: hypothetical protein VHB50_13815 [Bryobacteraceae bacterium]|nr:hypothetical protein [Bryobacteraceae bacterium]